MTFTVPRLSVETEVPLSAERLARHLQADTDGNLAGTELEIHQPTRTVDLRNAATDSWTDVLGDVATLARGIASTEFIPAGLRGSVEKVSAAILYSRELGLPPMTGLGSTHVIEGKAGISAELMRALILQAGHHLSVVKSDGRECVMKGRRRGTEEWTQTSFTFQEAAQIKFKTKDGWKPLTTKSNWQNYPADMLLARATTRLARMIFPDVIHGMRSVEELQDMVVEAELVDDAPPAPAKVSRSRRSAPAAPSSPAPARVSVSLPEPSTAKAAPVERSRVDVPPPPAAPKPEPAKPVEADEVVVEVVDAEPGPDTHPDTGDLVTPRQLALLHTQYSRLEITDREERLHWAAVVIGRDDLTSSKDLTKNEASQVIDTLTRCADREALEQIGVRA